MEQYLEIAHGLWSFGVLCSEVDKCRFIVWNFNGYEIDISTIIYCLQVAIYVDPAHKMGKHIVFSLIVCLSICLSVRHAFASALYLWIPWWDLQITQMCTNVWWGDVQCVWLTKVSSRSRIEHCLTVFRVRSFEPIVVFTNNEYDWVDVQCIFLTQGRFTDFNNSDYQFIKLTTFPMLHHMLWSHLPA